jgi:hypothetical protein
MTELVLSRARDPYQDRARLYRVRLDGAEVASIAAGEEKRVAVQPGHHTLQLTIDWCRSNLLDLSIQSGESQFYICGPNVTPLLGLIYASFLRNRYLYVRLASINDGDPVKRHATPIADSAVDRLPPISAKKYVNVLGASLLGIAIIIAAAWLLVVAQRSFSAPRIVFISVAGAVFGGATGAAFWLCRRALSQLDRG